MSRGPPGCPRPRWPLCAPVVALLQPPAPSPVLLGELGLCRGCRLGLALFIVFLLL